MRFHGPLGAHGYLVAALLFGCARPALGEEESTQNAESTESSEAESSSSATATAGGSSGESASSTATVDTMEGGDAADADDTADADASSDADAGDESAGFVDDDMGPPDANCQPSVQDCPEGEKCVWYATAFEGRRGQAKCIPITGEVQPYEPCELPNGVGEDITDDCGSESYCLEVYQTADHGFCAPFMTAQYTCPDYPEASPSAENGSNFPAACLYHECHPDLAESCPAGMQCTFYPAWIYGANHCWKVPESYNLGLGEACDFGDCGPGKLCMEADRLPECDGDRCCTTWCNLDTPECEMPGTTCLPHGVYESSVPEFETLGTCRLPE